MSLLVGFAPDARGKAVLHLAGMLARSADEDLVVCAVVPAPWYPSPARVDAEYQALPAGDGERGAGEGAHAAAVRHPLHVRGPRRALGAGRPAGARRAAGRVADRGGLVGGRRQRPRHARQREQPAALQLAAPGRHRAARLPLPAGRAGDAGDRRVRRHRERGEPRDRGGERRGAGRRDAAARLVRGALARAIHRRGRDAGRRGHVHPVARRDGGGGAGGAGQGRRPAGCPDRVRDRARPRRELGGGARRPRVGRRRRARRRLEHDRAGRARVPRLARREDRPPLPRPRRRRPARRGRGDRGGGARRPSRGGAERSPSAPRG